MIECHSWIIKAVGTNKNYDSSDVDSNMCLQCFDAVGWAAGRASGL